MRLLDADRRRGGVFTSTRQRVIVLTFDSPEEAEAWDDAGRPLDLLTAEVEVA